MANRFLNNIKINDSYTLPPADGTADQIIVTDGAGNLSFNDLNTVTESITGVQSNFTYYEVKNSSGAAIAEFKAVMAVGTDGNSGHILIDEMVADGSVEARYLLGITMDGGIANGEIGRVVAFGEIDQINTLAFSDGDVLWCDPANNGDFTITEPDGPNLKIPAAIVLNSATNGKIQVRVQTNEGIKDLYDTKIASQIDGDVLVWDNTTGVWFNDSTLNVDYTNGNVGIGTTSPDSKLEVASTGTNTYLHVRNDSTGSTRLKMSNLSDTNSNGFQIINNGSNGQVNLLNYKASTLALWTNATQRLTILSNGNVGIGTTSPSSKLEVNTGTDGVISRFRGSTNTGVTISGGTYGGVALSAKIHHESSNRNLVLETNGTGKLYFNTNGANARMVITDGGNVGIGTTSPTSQLSNTNVNSTDQAGIGHSSTAIAWRSNNQGYTATFDNYLDSTISNGLLVKTANTGAASYISKFESGGINRMAIRSDGNVGIGTASPGHLLEVRGTADALSVGDDSNTNTYARFANDRTYFGYLSSGNAFVQGGVDKGISFHTGSSTVGGGERMRINSSGNVGIGTTSPQSKLHVANGTLRTWTPTAGTTAIFESTANSRSFITITGTNETELWFGDGTTQTKGRVRYENNNDMMEFWTNTNPRMYINSAGNVGIGTASPGKLLELSGGANVAAIRLRDTTSNVWDIQNSTFGKLDFIRGGTNTYMRIDQSGNVGIGTTSPAYKLDVAGTARVSGYLYLNSVGSNSIGNYYGNTDIQTGSSTSLLVRSGLNYRPIIASAFTVSSDYRLKSNIEPLENAISRLNQLEVHRFNWNDRLDEPKVDGFIAHEVAPIIPEAVLGEKDEVYEDNTPKYQGIDQAKLVPLLTAALQEAIVKIEQLETRIKQLENNG